MHDVNKVNLFTKVISFCCFRLPISCLKSYGEALGICLTCYSLCRQEKSIELREIRIIDVTMYISDTPKEMSYFNLTAYVSLRLVNVYWKGRSMYKSIDKSLAIKNRKTRKYETTGAESFYAPNKPWLEVRFILNNFLISKRFSILVVRSRE